MNDDKRMAEITEIQAKYANELMLVPHVVGVGIGMRQRNGEYTDEMCLVVMVDEKIPRAQLATESILPADFIRQFIFDRLLDEIGNFVLVSVHMRHRPYSNTTCHPGQKRYRHHCAKQKHGQPVE